ncbi:MAG: glycosyl hydrolase 53 family protein [Planctomycetota bacterium]
MRQQDRLCLFVLASALTICATAAAQPLERVVAADISSVSRVADSGRTYSTFRGQTPLADAMKDVGYNTVRLRLWVDPTEGYSDLDDVLRVASEADAAGLDIWLNLHYSDSWADPGQQTKPAAWQSLNFLQLSDRIRTYTRDVAESFEAEGIPLTFVQVGNEIQDGMLWPDGQISQNGYGPFVTLLEAAIDGLNTAVLTRHPYVIIHSGGPGPAPSFFGELEGRGVDYDIAAISYYPYFHDEIANLENGLDQVLQSTDKPVIVAEIGYPWTFGFADGTTNLVGSQSIPDDVVNEYPATPAGQAAYIERVWQITRALGDDRGLGVAYWEPAWLPNVTGGSALENLALFGFNGSALPSFELFSRASSPVDGRGLGVDPVFSPPIAVQSLPPADPLVLQLDALYASHSAGGLHLGVSGNIESNTGTLFVFIDSIADVGTDTLAIPPDLQNGWSALDGLQFDPGFKPDSAIAVTVFDGSVFIDRFDLIGPLASFSYLGTVPLNANEPSLANGSNPTGIEAAVDNTNTDGIGGICARPLTATSGLELFLPRNTFDQPLDPGDTVGLSVLFLSREGELSTQWLPPLPDSVSAVLSPTGLNLGDLPALQYVQVTLDTDARRSPALATGDLNGDGQTDSMDVGQAISSIEAGQRAGDANGDGMVDFFDLLYILTLIDSVCP